MRNIGFYIVSPIGKVLFNICNPLLKDHSSWRNVIDLGCGRAALLGWLRKKSVAFEKYFGVDYAIHPKCIDKNAQLIRRDIDEFSMEYDSSNVIFLVNTICYLPDDTLAHLIDSIVYSDTVLVVEPKRGLFWDAYFSDVKIYYRSDKRIAELFYEKGFVLKRRSVCYGFNSLKYHHLIMLSYGLLFER